MIIMLRIPRRGPGEDNEQKCQKQATLSSSEAQEQSLLPDRKKTTTTELTMENQ